MQRPLKSRSNRRGATLVELAVCFPVLLMFVFGIIEFSRLLQLQHTIRLAAFEGARAGATLDSTTNSVQTKVTSTLSAAGIVAPTVTVSPLVYLSPTVTVTVSADPVKNAWLTWFVTGNGHLITSSITLDREVKAISVP